PAYAVVPPAATASRVGVVDAVPDRVAARRAWGREEGRGYRGTDRVALRRDRTGCRGPTDRTKARAAGAGPAPVAEAHRATRVRAGSPAAVTTGMPEVLGTEVAAW